MNAFQSAREREKVKAAIYFMNIVLLATITGLITHFVTVLSLLTYHELSPLLLCSFHYSDEVGLRLSMRMSIWVRRTFREEKHFNSTSKSNT